MNKKCNKCLVNKNIILFAKNKSSPMEKGNKYEKNK